MPVNVTASNGTIYHLYQLPDLSSPEPGESIGVTELENDLSNGYYSQVLFGSNTGQREFTLRFPSLAHADIPVPTVTGPNGESLSREAYLWDLYMETKVTGTPFVYPSSRSGQYFLVRFADERLSYERMRVKLFGSGVKLKQVRVRGVSVFSPLLLRNMWAQHIGDTAFSLGVWPNAVSGGNALTVNGDVTHVAANVNSHAIKRFSSSANTGYLTGNSGDPDLGEIFLVMKMREATFSNNAGVCGDGLAGGSVLIGGSGTTKFQNLSFAAGYTYRLNGTEFAQSNQQAPMNTWGIVHVRHTGLFDFFADGFQIGRAGTTAGTYAEMDLAEVLAFTQPQSAATGREITEYLAVKYGITT